MKMKMTTTALVLALAAGTTAAFLPSRQSLHSPAFLAGTHSTGSSSSSSTPIFALRDQIVSPFDENGAASEEAADGASATATATAKAGPGPYDLTWENVELVLDGMRDFLIADGGNVNIVEIDGPVVRLELVGNCGSCPSSTQTMKMGLERGLREKIPEIQEVVQSMPNGPDLCLEEIDVVLNGVRPFLQVAGGTIDLDKITGLDGTQPTVILKMGGSSASLNSVKLEIQQRLQRHFMMAGLRIDWS